jgi:hypothetical protein
MDARPPGPDLAQIADRIGAAATEAVEVAVGLGILGINRVQALRRQLTARPSRHDAK